MGCNHGAMTNKTRPGHPPWEPFNGMRIGGFTGVVIGAIIAALVSTAELAIIVGLAVVGAIVGWVVASREMRS